MYMASGFPWVDKTRRRSCHRRINSGELNLFQSGHHENHGLRGATLSRKIGLSTREGHGYSNTSRQNWRELGRVSLDMPMIRHAHHQHHTLPQTQETFLDTINPTKDTKVKKHKPSSPGGKLANFFNSLISQAVSKKKKSSKSSPQSVKDLVEEDSPSGWRRRRRSSISHFRSSTATSSFSTAFASRKPNNTPTTTRVKRTSMSDIDTKSIESCSSVSGSRTPPPYLSKSTPIKPNKQTNNVSTRNRNSAGNSDWLDEKFKMSLEKQSSSKGMVKSRECKRFVEEDGAESDSSSDLFELKLNYDHHDQLGYCGGGLPVYESTRMDSIKIPSGAPITNGPFKNGA